MLTVLSPAKSLTEDGPIHSPAATSPRFAKHAATLNGILRDLSAEQLQDLMGISEDLGALNWQRNQDFEDITATGSDPVGRPAFDTFAGDVYVGLDAATLSSAGFKVAQNHVRMLSGLYGVLRPMDMIQPHRLEMGTSLANPRGKNLYDYWGEEIAEQLASDLAESGGSQVVVNLASTEYFRSVKKKVLGAPIVTPVFLDQNPKGDYRVISFWAKQARGLMARWVVDHKVNNPEDLVNFDTNGYTYSSERSETNKPVFTRKRPA